MTKPYRVIVADDHPLFLEGVVHSLLAAPDNFAIVGQANDGKMATEQACRLHPDIVLLDINMPILDGIEAARVLSTMLPAVRIMMLTVSDNQEKLLSAIKAGAHGYVLKGVSAAELRTAVELVAQGEAYVTPTLAAALIGEFARPAILDCMDELTKRESDILELLGKGMTNREIGDALHLAEKTVKHYMTNILQKLHVRSRTEAALIAARQSKGEGR